MLRRPASKIDSGRSDETCSGTSPIVSLQEPFEFLFLRILPIQTVAAGHLFPPKLPRSDGPADELKSAADSRAERAFFDLPTPTNTAHVISKRSVNKVRHQRRTRQNVPAGRRHSCRAVWFPWDATFIRSIFSCKQTTWTACWAQSCGTANASRTYAGAMPEAKV
jgi:hypothetical protein